jgi:arabinan endo-1,5-alpha-L-arabinosidase
MVGYRVRPASGASGLRFDRLMRHRHVTDKSRIGIDGLIRPRVSGAIAFVLGQDLSLSGPDRATVIRSTNYVIPCLAITEDGDEDPIFALGNPPIEPSSDDLASMDIQLYFDDQPVRQDPGHPLTRHPADAVSWLAEATYAAGGLPKGTIVIADVFTSGVPLAPGGRIRVDVAGRGGAIAEFSTGREIVTIPDAGPALGSQVGDDPAPPLSIGEFETIYDPAEGEPEPWCLNDHCFARGPDGRWHLFGITHVKPFDHAVDPGTRLAHATSRTLLGAWRKEPFALTADPDRHDEHLLWAPHIVERDGAFHLFVCVGAREGYAYAIHRYESDDLWTWRRTTHGPVVVDGLEARDPMVLRDGDRWICYYTATQRPDGGHFVVAAVTSDDLITWSARTEVFIHPREGTFGGPTESPFVVRRGDRFYLFVTDDDTVHVYASHDPLHWSASDHVLAYTGHACEVIRDETGDWFISHVGWEQDGLWIAPLTWHDGLDHASASVEPARR